jgi:hypothetical protein
MPVNVRALLTGPSGMLLRGAPSSERSQPPASTMLNRGAIISTLSRMPFPIARPSIALPAHAFRDEVVLLGLKARRPVSHPHVFERINREVVPALECYGRRGWLDKPSGFFVEPRRFQTSRSGRSSGADASFNASFSIAGTRHMRANRV